MGSNKGSCGDGGDFTYSWPTGVPDDTVAQSTKIGCKRGLPELLQQMGISVGDTVTVFTSCGSFTGTITNIQEKFLTLTECGLETPVNILADSICAIRVLPAGGS